MTVCNFVGITSQDAFLYEGINYAALANQLYDATLGQWGTDERAVFEVMTKAVGEPVRRTMFQPVEVWQCAASTDGLSCARGHTAVMENIQARSQCARTDSLEGKSDAENEVRGEAIARLALAFQKATEARDPGYEFDWGVINKGNTFYPESILSDLFLEEMGWEDGRMALGIGRRSYNSRGEALETSYLTYGECMAYLLKGFDNFFNNEMRISADAVCMPYSRE